jgi:hypothetical protein
VHVWISYERSGLAASDEEVTSRRTEAVQILLKLALPLFSSFHLLSRDLL